MEPLKIFIQFLFFSCIKTSVYLSFLIFELWLVWSVQPVKNWVLCPSHPVIWLHLPLFTNTTFGIQTTTSYSNGQSLHLNKPSLPS